MIPFAAAMSRYRPTKASDNNGGWAETLGTAVTVYASIVLHKNKLTASVDLNEDFAVSDILQSDGGAQYRVLDIYRVSGTPWKTLDLERMARPINP